MMNFTWNDFILRMSLIILISFVTYENTRRCDFVFDDHLAIRTNPDVVGDGPWTDIFRHDFWGKDLRHQASHKSWRPLTVLSFRWNHAVSELNANEFHVVNVLVHAVAAAGTAVIGTVLSAMSRRRISYDRVDAEIGLWAGLLFAAHPVHVEAVTGVVGRADLLCAVFMMSAFVVHLKAIDARSFVMSCCLHVLAYAFVLLATLSKELGITMLGILMIDDVAVLPSSSWGRPLMWSWGRMTSRLVVLLAYLVVRALIMSQENIGADTLIDLARDRNASVDDLLQLFRSMLSGATLQTSGLLRRTENPFAFLEGTSRILSTAYVHAKYAALLVWPDQLCAEYSYDCIPAIESVFRDPRNLLTLATYTCLGLLCATAWYRRDRGIVLGIAWIVVPLLPASHLFLRIGTLIAERLLYVPSIGYAVLVSNAFVRCLRRKWSRYAGRTVFAAALAIMIRRARLRTDEWATDERLFESAVRVCPRSSKMQMMVGQIRYDQGRFEEALERYRMARDIDPSFCDLDLKFAEATLAVGDVGNSVAHYRRALHCKFVTERAWESLQTVWKTQLAFDKKNITLYEEIGATLTEMGGHHVDASWTYFREAAVLLFRRGEASLTVRRPNERVALNDFDRSLAILAKSRRCDFRYWTGMVRRARATVFDARGEQKKASRERRAAVLAFEDATKCDDSVAAAAKELIPMLNDDVNAVRRYTRLARVFDRIHRAHPDADEDYAAASSNHWEAAAIAVRERGATSGDSKDLEIAHRYYRKAVAQSRRATCATLLRAAEFSIELSASGVVFMDKALDSEALLQRASVCREGVDKLDRENSSNS